MTTFFTSLLIVLACTFWGCLCSLAVPYIIFILYKVGKARKLGTKQLKTERSPLDHDIVVEGARKLMDEKFSGLCPWVGPSPASWPIANPQEWEVVLYETNTHYYARLIFHEWVLWWSFDYPYLLVKIAKDRIPSGYDMTKRDDQLRLMWLWTNEGLHGWYDFKNIGFPNQVINTINGKSVEFTGFDTYTYKEYELVSDASSKW